MEQSWIHRNLHQTHNGPQDITDEYTKYQGIPPKAWEYETLHEQGNKKDKC